ncbi:MAG: sigma-70 family RNA polymerase sigma factor [Candidatus Dadabacteria bacterium]|nr:MAG: sigma-70 family RNA polymerase sigma factor [Candidatus Dadabacteria bacterium]
MNIAKTEFKEERAETEKRLSSLMVKVHQGDKNAYNLLLNELLALSRSFVAAQISNVEEREDIVQEILIGIHKAKHTFNPKKPFLPWFYAIARYKIVDYLRKYKRQRKREEVFHQKLKESPLSINDDSIGSFEELKDVLNSLTPYQKKVFSLVKIEGMSLKTAAKQLNTSTSAIKVTIHRVYQKIKRALTSE